MAYSQNTATFLHGSRIAEADGDEVDALLELGMACSSGSGGTPVDLIQAHKWFNLAAVAGSMRAQECRAEIADEMTARQIAEAQRQARAFLVGQQRSIA